MLGEPGSSSAFGEIEGIIVVSDSSSLYCIDGLLLLVNNDKNSSMLCGRSLRRGCMAFSIVSAVDWDILGGSGGSIRWSLICQELV